MLSRLLRRGPLGALRRRVDAEQVRAAAAAFPLQRRAERQSGPGRAELAESIRFGELLRADTAVLILDFPRDALVYSYALSLCALFAAASCWLTPLPEFEAETVLFLRAVASSVCAASMHYHARRVCNNVLKLVYRTRADEFELWRPRALLPTLRCERVPRAALLYTAAPALRRQGINLINTATLEGYFVDPAQRWERADLFSHLLGQNARAAGQGEFRRAV